MKAPFVFDLMLSLFRLPVWLAIEAVAFLAMFGWLIMERQVSLQWILAAGLLSLLGMVKARRAVIAKFVKTSKVGYWTNLIATAFAAVFLASIAFNIDVIEYVPETFYPTISERTSCSLYEIDSEAFKQYVALHPKLREHPPRYWRRLDGAAITAIHLSNKNSDSPNRTNLEKVIEETRVREIQNLAQDLKSSDRLPFFTHRVEDLSQKRVDSAYPLVCIETTHLYQQELPFTTQFFIFLALFFSLVFLAAVARGLLLFYSTRILALAFCLYRSPLRTIKMMPNIWVSRQFYHTVLSPPELFPGYEIIDNGISIEGDSLTYQEEPVYSVGLLSSLAIAIALSRIIFKLTAPMLMMLAFIANPLKRSRKYYRLTLPMRIRSSFRGPGIMISFIILTLFYVKIATILNSDEIQQWLTSRNLSTIKELIVPSSVTLWQICSVLSSLLYLATAFLEQVLFSKQRSAQSSDNIFMLLRMLTALERIRYLLVLYALICIVITTFPFLRANFSFISDIKVWTHK